MWAISVFVVVLTNSLSPVQRPTPQKSMKQETQRKPKVIKLGGWARSTRTQQPLAGLPLIQDRRMCMLCRHVNFHIPPLPLQMPSMIRPCVAGSREITQGCPAIQTGCLHKTVTKALILPEKSEWREVQGWRSSCLSFQGPRLAHGQHQRELLSDFRQRICRGFHHEWAMLTSPFSEAWKLS